MVVSSGEVRTRRHISIASLVDSLQRPNPRRSHCPFHSPKTVIRSCRRSTAFCLRAKRSKRLKVRLSCLSQAIRRTAEPVSSRHPAFARPASPGAESGPITNWQIAERWKREADPSFTMLGTRGNRNSLIERLKRLLVPEIRSRTVRRNQHPSSDLTRS